MIHGLPAESAAAALYPSRAAGQAGSGQAEGGNTGAPDARSGGVDKATAAPAESARRVTPAESADPKEKAGADKTGDKGAEQKKPNGQGLTEAEQKQVMELKKRDRQVKSHEQAHLAAGAGHIVQGAQYTFQQGPNGVRYAVGGDVRIDVSPVPGDPEATIEKAEQIRQAALAPPQPSAQDRQVAAEAMKMKNEARAEKLKAEAEEKSQGAPEAESSQAGDAAGSADSSDTANKAGNPPSNRRTRVNLFA